MKRAALVSAVLILAFCSGCGGGSSSSSSTSTKPHQRTGIATRAFVSNTEQGSIDIVDYTTDKLSPVTMIVDSGPTFMLLSPDGKTTLVYNSYSRDLVAVGNDIEQAKSAQSLGGDSDSIVAAPDNKTAYAAVRNFANASGVLGAVHVVDYTQPAITSTIQVPNARWVALDHAGKRLLVMSDVSDSIYSVDLTATTPTPTAISGFSRPVAAFFSSDDTKAYVVSCGPECGGTQAAVQEITFATGAIRSVAVQGASAATVNGTTMYVAGAPAGQGGTAQSVDLNAMTASAATNIGPGIHTKVVWTGSKAFVLASNCGSAGGCLSIYDPTANTALVDTVDTSSSSGHTAEKSRGNATGMAWISSRNVAYVAEGGELLIYDPAKPTTNCPANSADTLCPIPQLPSNVTLDIVGHAWDVIVVP